MLEVNLLSWQQEASGGEPALPNPPGHIYGTPVGFGGALVTVKSLFLRQVCEAAV